MAGILIACVVPLFRRVNSLAEACVTLCPIRSCRIPSMYLRVTASPQPFTLSTRRAPNSDMCTCQHKHELPSCTSSAHGLVFRQCQVKVGPMTLWPNQSSCVTTSESSLICYRFDGACALDSSPHHTCSTRSTTIFLDAGFRNH